MNNQNYETSPLIKNSLIHITRDKTQSKSYHTSQKIQALITPPLFWKFELQSFHTLTNNICSWKSQKFIKSQQHHMKSSRKSLNLSSISTAIASPHKSLNQNPLRPVLKQTNKQTKTLSFPPINQTKKQKNHKKQSTFKNKSKRNQESESKPETNPRCPTRNSDGSGDQNQWRRTAIPRWWSQIYGIGVKISEIYSAFLDSKRRRRRGEEKRERGNWISFGGWGHEGSVSRLSNPQIQQRLCLENWLILWNLFLQIRP